VQLPTHLANADCAADAKSSPELLNHKISEIEQRLTTLAGADRIEPTVDLCYLYLERTDDLALPHQLAHQMLNEALSLQLWQSAVECCDIIYQCQLEDSLLGLAHGIWLSVTYPVDPTFTVSMLHHLLEETPDKSDGGAVAAAVAHYIVQLRAEGKQREELLFFTAQQLGTVARRHSGVDSQDLFDFWMERLGLNDAEANLQRLAKILDVIAPADKWWFSRDELRQQLAV
jgi:hypothetical protein